MGIHFVQYKILDLMIIRFSWNKKDDFKGNLSIDNFMIYNDDFRL